MPQRQSLPTRLIATILADEVTVLLPAGDLQGYLERALMMELVMWAQVRAEVASLPLLIKCA